MGGPSARDTIALLAAPNDRAPPSAGQPLLDLYTGWPLRASFRPSHVATRHGEIVFFFVAPNSNSDRVGRNEDIGLL